MPTPQEIDEQFERTTLARERIPLEELKEGYLYALWSRNLVVGIYRHDPSIEWGPHFWEGPRTKFDREFVFEEHDWTSKFFGTCIPLVELEKAPEFDSKEAKLAYLQQKRDTLPEDIKARIERIWNERIYRSRKPSND